MTYDSATGVFNIYVNGVNVGTQTFTALGLTGLDANIAIGREQSGQTRFFTGQIDEAEIYSRALTPQEIADLYNAATFGKCKHGLLQFSAPTYSVNEAGPSATITVKRTDGGVGAASVHYATSNGTATASDYTAASGDLNWTDGDIADKTFTVPITDDSTYEGNETVNLTLSAATGGQLGPQSTAVLTITDNDSAPSFSIDDVTQTEGNVGTTSFTFTVTKTGSLRAKRERRFRDCGFHSHDGRWRLRRDQRHAHLRLGRYDEADYRASERGHEV